MCHGCYALKGYYVMKHVKGPRTLNFQSLPSGDWSEWVDGMTNLIKEKEKSGYFRWHDSGDLQSEAHLDAIVRIANNLPGIKFWLPTKEKAIIRRYNGIIPENLVVRLSSAMVDQEPSKVWTLTSTVHSAAVGHKYGVECQAYQNKGECGKCRSCWDATVSNISYPKH